MDTAVNGHVWGWQILDVYLISLIVHTYEQPKQLKPVYYDKDDLSLKICFKIIKFYAIKSSNIAN